MFQLKGWLLLIPNQLLKLLLNTKKPLPLVCVLDNGAFLCLYKTSKEMRVDLCPESHLRS
ncbi:hypothetical protein GCM10025857_65380 [Alicyclobacillus contaminans]|nr:hypothetical protein GCM10025857_65380 [Alicyclobacillus contaminans]